MALGSLKEFTTEPIAVFQLPIVNWSGFNERNHKSKSAIGNWQSEIGNDLHRATCAFRV
jgi:hypothetical protein